MMSGQIQHMAMRSVPPNEPQKQSMNMQHSNYQVSFEKEYYKYIITLTSPKT